MTIPGGPQGEVHLNDSLGALAEDRIWDLWDQSPTLCHCASTLLDTSKIVDYNSSTWEAFSKDQCIMMTRSLPDLQKKKCVIRMTPCSCIEAKCNQA